MNDNTRIHQEVSDYYSKKIKQHGDTPQGVDWNGEESQIIRFQQLSKLINNDVNVSVNDLGCGYGSYYDYLKTHVKNLDYQGIDLSSEMINSAVARQKNENTAHFLIANKPSRIADYCIASGIFNVKLERNDEEWWAYVQDSLNILDEYSRLGFAFNCLTSYSDAEKMREYLFYADPLKTFDLCKRKYSRNVALLHDYDLYEFTIIVRKTYE